MNAISSEPVGSRVELREQGDVGVLELCGEFGSLNWPEQHADLKSTVLKSLDRVPQRRMVIDLSRVTYAGSEFIGFLLGLRRHAVARGGDVVLASVREQVSDVLETLKLNGILLQYPSIDSAARALAGSGRGLR